MRGMTLWEATGVLDQVAAKLANLDALIEAQKAVCDRAKRLYNSKTIEAEEALLAQLEQLKEQNLPANMRAGIALALLADFARP